LVILLFEASFAQASIERFPNTSDFRIHSLALGGQTLWAIANKRKTIPRITKEGLKQNFWFTPETYLFKWNDSKKNWQQMSPTKNISFVTKIAASPQGEVYFLIKQRKTKKLLEAIEAIRRFASDAANKAFEKDLKAWVKEKKIDQSLAEGFFNENLALSEYSALVDEIKKKVGADVFIKAKLKGDHVYREAEKEFIKNKNITKTHTQPLLKYANGKLKQIYDFGKQKITDIAIDNQGTVFALQKQDQCQPSGKCTYTTSVLRWNKQSWEPLGSPLNDQWSFSVGKDGSVFVAKSQMPFSQTNINNNFFSWNNQDKSWKSIDLKIPQDLIIGSFSAVSKNNIWFNLLGQTNKAKLFHWNGAKLEKKIERKTYFDSPLENEKRIAKGIRSMAASPGKLFFTDYDGNLFVYTYSPASRKGVPQVKMTKR